MSVTTIEPANLEALAKKIQGLHGKVMASMKKSLDHAKECGQHLASVHADMPYKTFCTWIVSIGISEATANNYIRVHKNWQDVQGEDNYSAALKALRKTRKARQAAPVQAMTIWQTHLKAKMDQFKIKSPIVNMERFLESFGVKEAVKLAA